MNPFVRSMYGALSSGRPPDRRTSERMAAQHGITDKNTVKEMCELAVVLKARALAHNGEPTGARFEAMTRLYRSQANMSHRTSQSVMLQQYSTPVPIAFLAGEYVRREGGKAAYFEPSAGNGMLTVALPAAQTTVNEIDEQRSRHLAGQKFARQLRQDATQPFDLPEAFDGVVANPPFGKADRPLLRDGFSFAALDHLMVVRALDCMKNDGRAALIIGGHTEYDAQGRIRAGKNRIFFAYLYRHYRVKDAVNIDGQLYSRQGTSFNIRLILIDGRKPQPGGFPPLKTERDVTVKDFDALFRRIAPSIEEAKNSEKSLPLAKIKAKALKMRLALLNAGTGGMDGTGMEEVTRRFNRELQMQIDGTLPINHTYSLGRPSGILLAAGLPDLPIELRASMLEIKSSVEYFRVHPFRLDALMNLPRSLQNPVMVFDSKTRADSKVLLIDLKSGHVNFVAVIRLKYSPGSNKTVRAKVNSVRTIYPKDKVNDILEWICSGLLRYAEKKKASLFFKELHLHMQTSFKKSNAFRLKIFNRAANIIKNFVNPKKIKKR